MGAKQHSKPKEIKKEENNKGGAGFNEYRTKATTPPPPQRKIRKPNTGCLKRWIWQSCGKISQGQCSEKIKQEEQLHTWWRLNVKSIVNKYMVEQQKIYTNASIYRIPDNDKTAQKEIHKLDGLLFTKKTNAGARPSFPKGPRPRQFYRWVLLKTITPST